MEVEITIHYLNNKDVIVATSETTSVEPKEVLEVINKARLKRPAMQEMRLFLGNQKSNTSFVVMDVLNMDCLSLKEINDIIYQAQIMESAIQDKLNRGCVHDRPKLQIIQDGKAK